MTRTVTPTAVKRIISKGLTGWEAGKLALQDVVDCYLHRESVLTDADLETLRSVPMEGADVRDYNMFMALCRGFHFGYMLGEWACVDACLQISFLDEPLRDANKRRIVELFESCGPRIVTRKQYEDIVAAQRQKKLEFEYNLGYVIEEHFYVIAPPGAREEIEEICPDVESAEDFVAAVPEKYKGICKQAVDDIRRLHTSGRLPAVCLREDAKEAEPLLAQWKKGQLSAQDAMKLVNMLFVTGRQLYDCDELPEWKDYADTYHPYMFGDEDKRFQHAYAVLEGYSGVWVDKQGYYKGPPKPSEFITRNTEFFLGLINDDDKPKKSIESVGAELRDRLDTAEQNMRLFLAIKAILDAAAEAVGLDVPGDKGVLAGPNTKLGAFIAVYNIRIEELKEERKSWESGETRLEKALKMLSAIDPEKLKPSADSLKQLKANILKDAQGEAWLRTKVLSVQCGDGFNLKELLNR